MKTSVPVQCDLFGSVPTAPVFAILQRHHDELVELLSRLLWEVAQGVDGPDDAGESHEQDHH